MNHRQQYPRLIVLFILFVALGSCTSSKPQTTGNSRHPLPAVNDEGYNVVEGYTGNIVAAGIVAATISGGGQTGFPNQVTADMGSIGGGIGNRAGNLATIGGGSSNVASGFRATVGGGARNIATRDSATVGGGFSNSASGSQSTIGGGTVNAATEVNATVSGGAGNTASERHATVGGGTANAASGLAAIVAGGIYNTASAAYTSVGGGIANTAGGIEASVGGGGGNIASGEQATIAGGLNNQVTDNYSTVGGGRSNIAGNSNSNPTDAAYTTVGGGTSNVASGSFSVVPGGFSNITAGDYSFAAGRRANISAGHDGTFLYADSNDFDFQSLAANEFAARATGGVRFVTAIDAAGNPSAGVRLVEGSGSWESLSDRDAKTDFAPVDAQQILEQVANLPLTTWSYKTQAPSIRHIGPMAQDFAIFGVGEDDKHISSVDADGVALAAIQGLYQTMQAKDDQIKAQQQRIQTLETEVASQQEQLAALEARLAAMEKVMAMEGTQVQPLSASLRVGGPILGGLCLLGLILVQRRRVGD
jgi:uncharacterized coiled-coil protein SlyX